MGTLHHLKNKAEAEEPFKLYGKVKESLTVGWVTDLWRWRKAKYQGIKPSPQSAII